MEQIKIWIVSSTYKTIMGDDGKLKEAYKYVLLQNTEKGPFLLRVFKNKPVFWIENIFKPLNSYFENRIEFNNRYKVFESGYK